MLNHVELLDWLEDQDYTPDSSLDWMEDEELEIPRTPFVNLQLVGDTYLGMVGLWNKQQSC